MSDIARHASWGVSINGSAVSNVIDNSVQLSSSLQKAVLFAAGDLLPTLGATLTNTPGIQFRTHDLDLIAAPTKISSSFVLAMRAYDEAAGMGTGYVSFTVSKGIVVPLSISAQAGQPAELTVAVFPASSDGDSSPIAVGTTSLTLSTHGDAYVVGTVSIGGSPLTGVQSASLDFGYSVKTNAGENGMPFPTLAYYDAQQASLSATVTQLSAATAARVNTGQSTSASVSFRKLVEGGVPSGSYTATIAKALAEAQSVQGGRPVTTQILATPIYDGSGDDYLTFASA